MSSNDAAASAPRRRALGRGPATPDAAASPAARDAASEDGAGSNAPPAARDTPAADAAGSPRPPSAPATGPHDPAAPQPERAAVYDAVADGRRAPEGGAGTQRVPSVPAAERLDPGVARAGRKPAQAVPADARQARDEAERPGRVGTPPTAPLGASADVRRAADGGAATHRVPSVRAAGPVDPEGARPEPGGARGAGVGGPPSAGPAVPAGRAGARPEGAAADRMGVPASGGTGVVTEASVEERGTPFNGPAAPEETAAAPGGVGEAHGAPEGGAEGDGGDGRFKVRLANFEGPFDLLLQLIAKHKLDVTEVALSRVTDEFMAYIRALGPDWDLDETTEFLVVAATLLDLKAARLLPAAEVEDEGDLALLEARDLLFARLLQYRAYKRIADLFSGRLDDEARRFPRTVGLEPHHAELLPDVVISIGPEGFARLAVKAMQPKPRPQVYVDHIHAPLVSVQEQAGIVVARLKELGEASFRALVEDTDDTLTVVARFLALLELYREKAVALDQETALGELTVRWTGGDGDAVPAVTDEFDRPPEPPQEERTP
ncbi:segregation/condensation protein A [Streptomyces sp. Vc74B-19]|nr:segregation/condensation protein A [Streptomyces sp. Vc74B-19]